MGEIEGAEALSSLAGAVAGVVHRVVVGDPITFLGDQELQPFERRIQGDRAEHEWAVGDSLAAPGGQQFGGD
ncbi:hypothetical protein EKD04_014515 [Chloroflexales bacterium ZM16-3]|nr:hypothetical protein [Chloroflexales bacterium ZM16-3]